MTSAYKRKFLLNLALKQKWKIIFTIFLGITSSFFNGFSTALIAPVILMAMGQNIDAKMPKMLAIFVDPFQAFPKRYRILLMSIVILMAITLKAATSYFNTIISGQIVRSLSAEMREKVLEIFFKVDLDFLNGIQRGELINRISSEVDRSIQPIRVWISIVVLSLNIFIFASLLILLSWQLTIVLLILFPLPRILSRFLIKESRDLGKQMTTLNQNIASHLYEIVDGTKIVRSSCMEPQEYQRAVNYVRQKENLLFKTESNRALFGPVSEVTSILVIFLLILSARFIITDPSTLNSILFSYLIILYRLLPFLNQIDAQRSALAQSESVLDLVIDFLNRNTKPFTTSGDRPFTGLKEGIRFNHINFSYPGSRETILEDINLYVPRGTTLALVGPSGSGKSTLADLLPRFYHPTAGQIEIDGYPIQEFDLQSLRQSIGIVSQDTFVFNNTVSYNIAYGRDTVTQAEIEEAARRANAYDFIQELPQGFDTPIGNRGVRLSGGQRQRIAIARALIQNPEILILDEATSALDTVSERIVQKAIDELSAERTTIVIAHRLSTIQNAEQIAVLSKGRVMEVGTHEALLAKQGIYAELYQTQSTQLQDSSALTHQALMRSLRTSSYDTRTSLNSMLGSLSLMAEGLVDNEEEQYILTQNAFQEGLRLLQQLETLENWTRISQQESRNI
jgi:ATP-binding cassette, subfamily B, bacterial MsbA